MFRQDNESLGTQRVEPKAFERLLRHQESTSKCIGVLLVLSTLARFVSMKHQVSQLVCALEAAICI